MSHARPPVDAHETPPRPPPPLPSQLGSLSLSLSAPPIPPSGVICGPPRRAPFHTPSASCRDRSRPRQKKKSRMPSPSPHTTSSPGRARGMRSCGPCRRRLHELGRARGGRDLGQGLRCRVQGNKIKHQARLNPYHPPSPWAIRLPRRATLRALPRPPAGEPGACTTGDRAAWESGARASTRGGASVSRGARVGTDIRQYARRDGSGAVLCAGVFLASMYMHTRAASPGNSTAAVPSCGPRRAEIGWLCAARLRNPCQAVARRETFRLRSIAATPSPTAPASEMQRGGLAGAAFFSTPRQP